MAEDSIPKSQPAVAIPDACRKKAPETIQAIKNVRRIISPLFK
jgi:hypothetical protein